VKYESPKYHIPRAARAWNEGVERHGAGIFFLDGACHFAARRSTAEQELLERGALLIGSVRFDTAPHEASHAGRAVHPLTAREAAERLHLPAARN
jgi:hypothetical protein